MMDGYLLGMMGVDPDEIPEIELTESDIATAYEEGCKAGAQALMNRMYALTWEYRGDAYKAMQKVIGEYELSVPKMEPTT